MPKKKQLSQKEMERRRRQSEEDNGIYRYVDEDQVEHKVQLESDGKIRLTTPGREEDREMPEVREAMEALKAKGRAHREAAMSSRYAAAARVLKSALLDSPA